MSHEIYYTSAPEGLKPHTSGFCTVAASENIPKALWDRLETLSAYRHHFTTASGDARENPVSYAHWLLSIAGANYHVLSRVCDSGVDHTQRTNAFADHLVIENSEMAAGGPAWMLLQKILADHWDGLVGALPQRRLPQGDASAAICMRWKELTGDGGWAGHLADLFVKTPTKPVCILFSPGQEILPLIAEAIALLPPSARWLVTFNTYFTSMPTSATCAWRACLAGSPAAQLGMRYASSGLIVDLTDPARLGVAPDGPYAMLARTGIAPAAPAKPAAARPAAGRPQAKPAKPEELYELDEEEEEKEFEFEINEPPVQAATAATPVPPREIQMPIPAPVKRTRPIMREADKALRVAEQTADSASARRRKQFAMLFFAALGALALGMALVIFALHNTAPPEIPPIANSPTSVPAPTTIAANPTPTPPPPPAPIPTPIIPKTQPAPVIVYVPPITPKPTPPPPPVIHYPAIITLKDALEKPTSASGSGDMDQPFFIAPTDIDPAAPVTAIRFLFPGDANNKTDFGDPDTLGGTLSVEKDLPASPPPAKPRLLLRWKGPNDVNSVELLAISYSADRAHPALDLSWKIGPLTTKPDAIPVLYWILQSSTIALDTARGSTQRLAFPPFSPPPINLLDAETHFTLPVEFPGVVDPVLASALPPGWTADPYAETDKKNAVLRSVIARGLSFKKSSGALDTTFLVTFDSSFQTIKCNFSAQLASDQKDLQQAIADLQATDDALKQATVSNNGQLPDNEATRKLTGDRADKQSFVDAYKQRVAGYNDINAIDIALELPGKAQVVVFHIRRQPK